MAKTLRAIVLLLDSAMADPTVTGPIQPEALQGQITFSASSSQTTLAGAGSALASANDENAIRAKQLAKAEKFRLNKLAKTFGHIPNVSIGTTFSSRSMCAKSAVHTPPMAGIFGSKIEGAYSIVMSGGYKDDEDRGDTIIYTGAGGRQQWSDKDPPKRLHFGPQVRNQTWDDWGNRSLVVSRITGLPVRVVRGWMACTKYSPLEGYRYDGLYTVVSHWMEKNDKNLDICRYRLERLPGQPPIPLRPIPPAPYLQQQRQSSVYNTQMRRQPSSTTEPTPFNVDAAVHLSANTNHAIAHLKRKDFDYYCPASEEEGPPSKKIRRFAICSISGGRAVEVGVLTLHNANPEPSSTQNDNENEGGKGGNGDVLFSHDSGSLIQENTISSTPSHISISSPISRSPSPTLIIESEPSGSRHSSPSVIMVPEERHESAQEQEERMDVCSTPDSEWVSPPPLPSPLTWASAGELGSTAEECEIEGGALPNAQNADDVLGDSFDVVDYLLFAPSLSPQPSIPDLSDIDSCATNETVQLKDAKEDKDDCSPAVAGALSLMKVGESDADA